MPKNKVLNSEVYMILSCAPLNLNNFINLFFIYKMSDENKVIHSGWGTKLGAIFKTWRYRWFVLTQTSLSYSKTKTSAPNGIINLSQVSEVAPMPECIHPHAFKVVIPNVRTYQIFVESDEAMNEWVRVLNKVLGGKSASDVSVDDFDILKVLGKGSYGKVQLVKHKGTNQIYAMKSISKRLLGEYELVSRIITERDVLLKINHPFLVSARYAFQTETKIFLVLDYVQGGELFSRLREERKFVEERARYYIAELAHAIGYLHSMGICHRDLKPENILFDKDGYIKLTDFGLVKEQMTKDATTTTFCGTPEYLAPEMVAGNAYDNNVDWWALGTLSYEMLYGVPPFYDVNTNAMYRSILRDDIVFPEDATEDAIDFIQKLLDKNPTTRLGSGPEDYKEVIGHKFFASINFDQLLKKQIPMQWKPQISSNTDVSAFDREFTTEKPKLTYEDPSLIGQNVQRQLQGFTYMNEE
ncbi:AGC family protein kinase [Trichomonas vaginalis G3]|uniref:non-specific serine/threonine protein kinase n=1 Tax=Trichomonas vaginalis (strain ATCC PRA-98 / G3) TaxID=412133 RepID=A2FLX7_TRIV3|nr:glycogen cell differentiation involved in embryonic placenta development [Trichomonas vaginalis G3]EAX94066.1 AGC family protein kinase [Trichomonas vaginalis G3]KAI5488056.1 glycogen cell differentiation involved in embryonic placenta development [Trichomonas vaginalis G3]|eukprot:XP_001306996.1 AGC family protein kinase [Trichomonas vaginalis G3]